MIESLNFEQALEKESELWVVPSVAESPATAKLNWYMNFQLSQLDKQTVASTPSVLAKIVEQTGLQTPTVRHNDISLVTSKQRLPCRWVLVVPSDDIELSDWLEKALKAWEGLKKPSCHFFLPHRFDAGEANRYLKNKKIEGDFSIVLN